MIAVCVALAAVISGLELVAAATGGAPPYRRCGPSNSTAIRTPTTPAQARHGFFSSPVIRAAQAWPNLLDNDLGGAGPCCAQRAMRTDDHTQIDTHLRDCEVPWCGELAAKTWHHKWWSATVCEDHEAALADEVKLLSERHHN